METITLTITMPLVAWQHFLNAVCVPGVYNPDPATLPADAEEKAKAKIVHYIADTSGANAIYCAGEHARQLATAQVATQKAAILQLVQAEVV